MADVLWGTDGDRAVSIEQASDGGYVMAGSTESTNGDVNGNHGTWDAWIVKLDDAGALQWQQCLGGSFADHAYSIQQTGDGGYIVAGSSESNDGDVNGNHGAKDVWAVKLNGSGSLQWQSCLGGTGVDWALSISQSSDGGYIMAGGLNPMMAK